MHGRLLLIVASVLVFATHPARAELTAFWQSNPISLQAIASDPALSGMQSWSLMVTNTESDFISAGLRAVLPEGSTFYNVVPFPFQGDGFTRPHPLLVAMFPHLAYDTYVTSPQQILGRSGAPAIFGGFPALEPLSTGGPLDPDPGTFSISWGHPKAIVWNLRPGTFELMRATFPLGDLPQIHFESGAYYLYPEQMVFFPTTIPEPTIGWVAMLIAAAFSVLRQRALPCIPSSRALPGAPPCLQSH